MFNYILNKIRARKESKKFKEFGFRIAEFQLSTEGTIQYAQWLHPGEFVNHPGASGNIVTQETVDFYRRFIKEGDSVVDVGAHEGDTIVPMALAAGKTGTSFAFEPNPQSFKVLTKNAELNPDKLKIVSFNFAATTTDGEFTFGSGDASFGNGGIVGFTHNKKRNTRFTFQVQGRNIEKFLHEKYAEQTRKIALIKVDAEGYDKEILKTLPKIIEECRPIIITECFGPSTTEEKAELFNFLTGQKYTLFKLEGFTTENIAKISSGDMTGKKTFDILAVPIEKEKHFGF